MIPHWNATLPQGDHYLYKNEMTILDYADDRKCIVSSL